MFERIISCLVVVLVLCLFIQPAFAICPAGCETKQAIVRELSARAEAENAQRALDLKNESKSQKIVRLLREIGQVQEKLAVAKSLEAGMVAVTVSSAVLYLVYQFRSLQLASPKDTARFARQIPLTLATTVGATTLVRLYSNYEIANFDKALSQKEAELQAALDAVLDLESNGTRLPR